MEFLEVTITTTTEGQELVADILWDYSTHGVAICDTNDVLELINYRRQTFDYISEELEHLKPSTLVKGYLDLDFDLSILEDRLMLLQQNAFLPVGSLEMVKRVVENDDWVEIWKKHYKPIQIGDIVVCPNWIDFKTDKITVKIDTSMAFGTGEHETTCMVLEKLQKFCKKGTTVIDVGTGSGILGIACAKLGAKTVYMTDIDQMAVDSAIHNAKVNNVLSTCEIVKSDLLEDARGNCDLIVANITAPILLILSKTVLKYMKKGSVIILSGILKTKVQEVLDCYLDLGLKEIEHEIKGEWASIVMEKVDE